MSLHFDEHPEMDVSVLTLATDVEHLVSDVA